MVTFTGLSPKQAQAIEALKNHIFLPDVEVAVAQSDHASISIKGVQKAVDAFVERYEEYTIAPVIQACTYHADANLYGALVNWLQEENQW